MARDDKPLDLPGFYWDEERRRYFPIGSRPKRKAIEDEPVVAQTARCEGRPAQRWPAATSRSLQTYRAGTGSYFQRTWLVDQLEGRSFVNSYTELDPAVRPLSWYSSNIASFYTTTVDDTLNVLIGDSRGVLHCSRAVIKNGSGMPNEPDRFNDNSRVFTSYHLGTGSAISHIVSSGSTAVTVSSTCDSCLLGIRDLKAPEYSGFSFPRINMSGDIWAANLLEKRLALGMSKRLIWIKDIQEATRGHRTLHTRSDVLSMNQGPNTITAGLRSGEVRLFDVRTKGDASTELFGSRFSGKGHRFSHSTPNSKSKTSHSAITHLQEVNEWEMLVGTSAGELEMFDLRFATGGSVEPTMSLRGHVNSYLLDLGITIDPSSTFLFAAGQDRRIRTWSLRTGEYLGTLLGGAQLNTPSRALVVTQSGQTGCGTKWLWIAQEDEVRVVRLGG